jgi:hypothetical protein
VRLEADAVGDDYTRHEFAFLLLTVKRSNVERHQIIKGCQSIMSQTTSEMESRPEKNDGGGGNLMRTLLAMIILDTFHTSCC